MILLMVEIRLSPVEVGRLSHYFSVLYIPSAVGFIKPRERVHISHQTGKSRKVIRKKHMSFHSFRECTSNSKFFIDIVPDAWGITMNIGLSQ